MHIPPPHGSNTQHGYPGRGFFFSIFKIKHIFVDIDMYIFLSFLFIEKFR
jgi:hypothetical protein